MLVIPLPPVAAGFYDEGWIQMDESHLLRPTFSFSQRDLNEGRVWYVTSGEKGPAVDPTKGYPYLEPSDRRGPNYGLGPELSTAAIQGSPYSEVVLFSVSDSSNPPNVLKDQTFVVHIEEPQVPPSANNTKTDNQLHFEVNYFQV